MSYQLSAISDCQSAVRAVPPFLGTFVVEEVVKGV